MREGLRSATKLSKETEEPVVKNDQSCNGEKDCDSGMIEETCTFTSNQDVDFGQKDGDKNLDLNCDYGTKDGSNLVAEVGLEDGSECKESYGNNCTAEVGINARKKRRIDAAIESTGNVDIEKTVESKEVVDETLHCVGRVLRSRTVMKAMTDHESNTEKSKVFVSKKQAKGRERADNNSVEAKKGVEGQFEDDFGNPLNTVIEEKPNAEDNVTPLMKTASETYQQYNGEKDFDSGTKEDTIFSTSKQVLVADLNDEPKVDDLNCDFGTKEDESKLVAEASPKDDSKCKVLGENINYAEVRSAEVVSERKRKIDGETERKLLAHEADCDIGEKAENKKVMDKPQSVGRVLRSRSSMNTKCENQGKDGQSIEVVAKKQLIVFESSESFEDKKEVQSHSNDAFRDPSDSEIEEKPKARRGRPPKYLEGKRVEVKEYVSNKNSRRVKVKGKRGRPRKAKNPDEVELEKEKNCQFDGRENDRSNGRPRKKLKKKRGRPRLEKEDRKVGFRENIEKGNSQVSRKRSAKVESKGGHPISVKKNKCGDNAHGESTFQRSAAGSRLEDKQVVRDKIVELLKGAGWTVQHRPRNGRAYSDSVYVNPKGRTHWSVTLAYRVFVKDSDKSGIKFTPIPAEELNILTRIVSKERSDKNKKKRKKKSKQEECYDEESKIKRQRRKLKKRKLHKRKLESAGSLSRKASCGEQGDSVRGRKRVKVHNKKGFALMARDSKDVTESKGDGYVLYSGKWTVLSWMINLGTVLPNTKVQHFKRRKARFLNGRITTDGIQCDCCNETFTISDFESHAGTKTCQPLKNIHLESGASLLQCQLDTWHKQDERVHRGFHSVDVDGEDPNDDTCGICGDGGSLMCCDSCPSTFHQSCLGIESFPSGVWHCMYCLCKLCGQVGGNICQDDDDAAGSPTLLTCFLCEEKYHQSCVQFEDNLNDDSSNFLFCGKSCQELYEKLQTLLGVKHEIEEGFSWSFVHRFDVSPDFSVNGMARKVECNSKVAVAFEVMNECFSPMVDHRSDVNLIHNVVYNFGSNFTRLNYSGFLTAILERGDEITAVASVRIHGNSLAEMPFIGTRHMYRRQGMCRRLLSGIETALRSLHVEKLIIPAISELMETWTSVFGFLPLEDSMRQKIKNLNLMVFPGVDMLQKPMLVHNEENLISEGHVSILEGSRNADDLLNDSGERCSAESGLKTSSETGSAAGRKADGDPTELESVPALSDRCLNDASDVTTENIPEVVKVNGEVTAIESASHVSDGCLRDTNDTSCKETDTLACGSAALESTSLPITDSSAVTNQESKHGLPSIDINVPNVENGHFDFMDVDDEMNLSRGSDAAPSDTIIKPVPQASESNGHHSSEKLTPISCGIDLNVVNCPIEDTPRRITRTSELLSSDNTDVGFDDVGHGDSDVLRNSGTIGIHCASGGGNGCAATEVVVLSNQAS